jgi:hypothetical protein
MLTPEDAQLARSISAKLEAQWAAERQALTAELLQRRQDSALLDKLDAIWLAGEEEAGEAEDGTLLYRRLAVLQAVRTADGAYPSIRQLIADTPELSTLAPELSTSPLTLELSTLPSQSVTAPKGVLRVKRNGFRNGFRNGQR